MTKAPYSSAGSGVMMVYIKGVASGYPSSSACLTAFSVANFAEPGLIEVTFKMSMFQISRTITSVAIMTLKSCDTEPMIVFAEESPLKKVTFSQSRCLCVF